MNGFYKVKGTFYNDNKEHCGVVIGENEGELMTKVMAFYGADNINEITFWFGEGYDYDVIELEDFKDCPLFDFHKNF